MRFRLVHLVGWAAVLFALLSAPRARAREGATLVALVTTDPTAELSHRVEEQLEALGLDVLVLNPPVTGSAGPTALEQAARNVGALAAIRIVPMAQSVQVWTVDPVSGQSVFRELLAPSGQKPSDASVALGAVELLRASLLELHPPEAPAAPKAPAPPVTCPPPPPLPPQRSWQPRVGIAAGAGVDFAIAGRPAVSWETAAWLRLSGRVGARVLVMASLSDARLSAAPYGDLLVDTQLYGGELTYDLAPSESASVPVVGLGLAAVDVAVRGLSAQNNVNLDDSNWRALPFVQLGESWSPLQGLRLRADLLGGLATAAISACVAQRTGSSMCFAQWGEPLVNVSLGAEVLIAP
jgi:hypothetical protein